MNNGLNDRYAAQLQRETEQMLHRQNTSVAAADQQLRSFSCRSVFLSLRVTVVRAHVMLTCTNGVSLNHLSAIVASD